MAVFYWACHGRTPVAAPAKDTVTAEVRPVYGIAAKDTGKKPVARVNADRSGEDGDELKVFYNGYIASYTQPCVIDSAFQLGVAHYRLQVKDSCLMDSAITVPKGYVDMYKLDSFVTHNFISKVRLEKEGKMILERVITKKDFNPLLFEAQRRYAAMMCPNMDLKGDTILVGYSISIPLTDVGTLEYMVIDRGGNVTFRKPGPGD